MIRPRPPGEWGTLGNEEFGPIGSRSSLSWTPTSLQGDLEQFISEGDRLRDRLVEVEIHIMALERLLGKGAR